LYENVANSVGECCTGTTSITPEPSSSYTVTYFGNTNTSGTVPVDGSSPYAGGSTVTILGNSGTLAKTGYQFAGWNTAADGSGTSYVGDNTFTINANTNLYAQWIIGGVRLVYNAGTGGTGTAPVSSGTYYTAFSIQPVVGNTGSFTNGTKVFGGWNTAADGSGTSYPAGSEYTMPGAGTVNLYAQWIDPATTYTLTYNAGTGGSGTAPAAPTTYSANSPATILGNTGPYTNSDTTKVFYGWNTAADGSGTSIAVGSTFPSNVSTTLYAAWEPDNTGLTPSFNTNTSSPIGVLASTAYVINTVYTNNTNDLVLSQYADKIQIIATVPSGTLAITTTTNLTLPTGYQAASNTAAGTISFIGNLADVNAALATLKYTAPTTAVSTTISITASYAGINGD
jgi:uncharacterized repeat protein (TIGR02543 family)